MSSSKPDEKKKDYHPPELRLYGDIRELTQTTLKVGSFPDAPNDTPTGRKKS